MPSIVCAICLAKFTADDDIYTTQCGHTFHASCEQHWRANGPFCPICRYHKPTSHKIFLSFETTSADVELRDLQLQYNRKLSELHALRKQMKCAEQAAQKVEKKLQQRNAHIKILKKTIRSMKAVEIIHGQELTRSIMLISKLEHEVQQINAISRKLSPAWFNVTRVIIGGISRRYRKDNLTNLVIGLAQRMGVPMQRSDIRTVNVLGTNYKAIPQHPTKFNLLVAMNTPHMAQSLILQKFLLFTNEEFKSLLIKEYRKSPKWADERLIIGGLSNALRILDILSFLVAFAAKLNVHIDKSDIDSVHILDGYQAGADLFDDEHTLILCVKLISVELANRILDKKRAIKQLDGFGTVFVRKCPCNVNGMLSDAEIVSRSPVGDISVSPTKRVAVVGLTEESCQFCLFRVILDLAHAMSIELCFADILSVEPLNDKHFVYRQGSVNLLVEFHKLEKAAWFFLWQQRLAESPQYVDVRVKLYKTSRPKAYVDNTLEYAKTELKAIGYKTLYVINGVVYARKNNCHPIYKIANREDVDMLLCDQFECNFVEYPCKVAELHARHVEN